MIIIEEYFVHIFKKVFITKTDMHSVITRNVKLTMSLSTKNT